MASAADARNAALNLERNQYLGNVLYVVVGIVTFIGLITSLVTSYRATNYDDGESQASLVRKRPTRLKTWFRRRFLLPALFGRKHIQPLGYYQFPTRGQTLMVAGYALLNLVFLATDYPGDRTIKALADRAGHLAVVNLPLYFLFAGRNNLLIWVTSWPQRDFQVFHKWIARTSTLEAVIHSAGYGYVAAQNHWDVNAPARKTVWINGISATVVACSILLFSVMSARKHCYELFLVVHILGAILFLAFLYHHLGQMPHHYAIYLWICVTIWALDRILRVVRLAIFNKEGRHPAKARIITGTSTILLTVYPNIKDVGFAPGVHYFLYFPDNWCFWESHPFTALSWRPTGPTLTRAPPKVLKALEEIPDPELEKALESEVEQVIDPANVPLPASVLPEPEIESDDEDDDGGMTVLSSYNDKVIDDSDDEEEEDEEEDDEEKSDDEEKKPRRPRKEREEEKKKKKEEKKQKKEARKSKKEERKSKKEERKSKKEERKPREEKKIQKYSEKEIQKSRIITTSSARRGPARPKLTFLIHPRKGMTRTLLNRLLESPHHSLDMSCLLEGPYGIARPVQAFPTVVVIAGGVGMSTALPYLQQHMSKGVEITRRFLLIWSVRDGIMAQKILASIKSLGLSFRKDVELKLYITRANEGDSFLLPAGVKVRYRRPKIERSIQREAKRRVPGTPMAVVACGGAAVVDCARKGSVMALERAAGRKGMGEIVYWEEGYGW